MEAQEGEDHRGGRPAAKTREAGIKIPLAFRILGLVALSILPCLGIIVWSGTRLEREALAGTERDCRFIAASVAARQRILLDAVAQTVRGAAEAPPVRDANAAEAARMLAPMRTANKYIDRMSLCDPGGRVLASSDGAAAFAPALVPPAPGSPDAIIVGSLSERGGAALPLWAPIRGRDGEPAGFLAADLSLAAYPDVFAFAEMPAATVVAISDRDGLLLYRRPSDDGPRIGEPIDRGLLALARGSPGRGAEACELADGTRILAAAEGVDGDGDGIADIRVFAYLPMRGVLAPIRGVMRDTYVLVAIAAAVSLALALAAAQFSLVRRVRAILERARYFEHGDLAPAGLPSGSRDELLELSSAMELFDAAIGERESVLRLQEDRLRGALGENDVLLREVHHRVYNNLQIVLSLLRLEEGSADCEESRAILRNSEGRVQSMALAHARLYEAEDLSRVDFAAYAADLIGSLRQEYPEAAGKVAFLTDMQPVAVELTQAVPLGLILNELLSNCLAHAFPEGSRGTVVAGLSDVDGRTVAVTVADDGIGVPAAWDGESSPGLGLHLVRNLANQLGGSFRIGPAGPGTRAVVEFPLASAGEAARAGREARAERPPRGIPSRLTAAAG